MVPFDMLGMVSYYCPIATLSDFKNAVTLKTGLWVREVIENVTIRYRAYDFLLMFYNNYGSISCRF